MKCYFLAAVCSLVLVLVCWAIFGHWRDPPEPHKSVLADTTHEGKIRDVVDEWMISQKKNGSTSLHCWEDHAQPHRISRIVSWQVGKILYRDAPGGVDEWGHKVVAVGEAVVKVHRSETWGGTAAFVSIYRAKVSLRQHNWDWLVGDVSEIEK